MCFGCQIHGHLLGCRKKHRLLLWALMAFLCSAFLPSLSCSPCSSFPFSVYLCPANTCFVTERSAVNHGLWAFSLTGEGQRAGCPPLPSLRVHQLVVSPESARSLGSFSPALGLSVCLAPTGACAKCSRLLDSVPLLASDRLRCALRMLSQNGFWAGACMFWAWGAGRSLQESLTTTPAGPAAAPAPSP